MGCSCTELTPEALEIERRATERGLLAPEDAQTQILLSCVRQERLLTRLILAIEANTEAVTAASKGADLGGSAKKKVRGKKAN